MVRIATASVCLVAIVWLSVVGGGQTSAAAEKAPIQLTERDYDRVVQASNGDTIEVWLPNSMPYSWGLMEALPVLQPLPARPRGSERGKPEPDAPPPSVGGSRPSVHRYKVVTERNVTATPMWVYCFGTPENTKKRKRDGKVAPHENFSPDLKPSQLKEGMVFKIKLEARP